MDKAELNKKLSEFKSLIINNSKDVKLAAYYLDRLLSVKGELGIEPTIVHVERKDVQKSCKGNSFSINVTPEVAHFHTFGYDILATREQELLYFVLSEMADLVNASSAETKEQNTDSVDATIDKEKKPDFDILQTAMFWCLQTPRIAVTNQELSLQIAHTLIDGIQNMQKLSEEQLKQLESPELDAKFEQMARGLDGVSSLAKEETKENP